jgi:hypothetical protein
MVKTAALAAVPAPPLVEVLEVQALLDKVLQAEQLPVMDLTWQVVVVVLVQ